MDNTEEIIAAAEEILSYGSGRRLGVELFLAAVTLLLENMERDKAVEMLHKMVDVFSEDRPPVTIH
jgi:hypothetical protein